jgi:hypothetical protein
VILRNNMSPAEAGVQAHGAPIRPSAVLGIDYTFYKITNSAELSRELVNREEPKV